MIKSIVVLIVLLGGLVCADVWLTASSGETRRTSSKVRRLVPPEQREGKLVSVVRLEIGGRPLPVIYARNEGVWRCLSYRQALVSDQLMESVLTKLFNGEGVVQSDDTAKAATYGFDSPAMLRISFHGARALEKSDGDKLFSFDVGSTIPTMNGCYVRLTGSKEIWSIDQNLRDELAPADQSPLPPLVERKLMPGSWPGAKKGVKNYKIEPAGAPAYEIEGRRREVTQEEMRTGKSPIQWFVKVNGEEQPANDQLAMSYVSFLQMAPRLDVADPKLEPQAGISVPRARITIVPNEGDPLTITLGSGTIGAGAPIVNSFGKTLDLASPLFVQLMTPRAEQLTGAGPNPWEPFLKQQQAQQQAPR